MTEIPYETNGNAKKASIKSSFLSFLSTILNRYCKVL